MDAVDFIRERNRMCTSFGVSCNNCPADKNASCDSFAWKEELVSIVENWAKENPRKTRQSVLLEQWPEAMIDREDLLSVCPQYLNRNFKCRRDSGDCGDCRREFWMQEIK